MYLNVCRCFLVVVCCVMPEPAKANCPAKVVAVAARLLQNVLSFKKYPSLKLANEMKTVPMRQCLKSCQCR